MDACCNGYKNNPYNRSRPLEVLQWSYRFCFCHIWELATRYSENKEFELSRYLPLRKTCRLSYQTQTHVIFLSNFLSVFLPPMIFQKFHVYVWHFDSQKISCDCLRGIINNPEDYGYPKYATFWKFLGCQCIVWKHPLKG